MRTFETAIVQLAKQTVMLVALPVVACPSSLDAAELGQIHGAFERACPHPIVLMLQEPCGCVTLLGTLEHTWALDRAALPPLMWQPVSIDLASPRPILRRRRTTRRRVVVN